MYNDYNFCTIMYIYMYQHNDNIQCTAIIDRIAGINVLNSSQSICAWDFDSNTEVVIFQRHRLKRHECIDYLIIIIITNRHV